MLPPLSSISILSLVLQAAYASPHVQKRSAAVVPVLQRSNNVPLHAEIERIQRRYEIKTTQGRFRPRGKDMDKRDVAVDDLYDINTLRSTDGPYSARLRQRRGSASGSSPLINLYTNDVAYFTMANVGTPAQSIGALVDTGSSDFIIPTTDCTNCDGTLFNVHKSTTYTLSTNLSFSLIYDDGSGATGVVAYDTISVAGLQVTGQVFAAINKTKGFSGPYEAIFGMDWTTSYSITLGKPFIFNLVSSGTLVSNIFSLYLTRNGADGSELCIGCLDSSKYTGNIQFYGIYSTSDWALGGVSASIGGTTLPGQFVAAIDSGTSQMYIPVHITDELYAKIPNVTTVRSADGKFASYYLLCKDFATLPPIGFNIGGTVFTISREDFRDQVIKKDSPYCYASVYGSSGKLDDGQLFGIIGDAFLKSWYSVFDIEKKRIGFAQAVHKS